MKAINKKVVLIDLDNTLFDFTKSEKECIKIIFNKYNIQTSKKNIELYEKINARYWEKLERGEMTKEEILVERFREFFSLVNCNNGDAVEANAAYLYQLSLKGYYVKGALKLLSGLKKKGYLIYLISNGIKFVQEGRLKSRKRIIPYFDKMYISECIGYTKPEVGFVEYILKDIDNKYNKDEMIIIGDSLTSDMQLGFNAGIDTIWYNPKGKEPKDKKPNFIVNDLDEISKIL